MSDSDSFAALFEAGDKKTGVRRNLPRVGENIEATVVQIGKESVFVELDSKTPAYVPAEELRTEDGTIPLSVGDRLQARVVFVDQATDEVRLSRSRSGSGGSLAAIEQAKAAGLSVEGRVTKENKGGYEIDLGGVRAFCPQSQIGERVSDPKAMVGRTFPFAVIEIKDGGRSVVVSRRVLVERDAKDAATRVLAELKPGSVLRGTVTSVREFGAFVDLGGIEGLIPASEISHDRSASTVDLINAGDTVSVLIREIKQGTHPRTGEPISKVTLSLKALAKDPWDDIESAIIPGKVTAGTVVRVTDFGAFVRLVAGVEGLLHVSETSSALPLSKLAPGQHLCVIVKDIDKEQKRVSLIAAPEGFTLGASVSAPKFGIGAVVTGIVERIEAYGIFLQVEGTAGRGGRGLVPSAELGVARGTDIRSKFPIGTKLKAKVLETGDGKLKLSVKAALDAEERAQFEAAKDAFAAPQQFGTLGDLMKAKLGK